MVRRLSLPAIRPLRTSVRRERATSITSKSWPWRIVSVPCTFRFGLPCSTDRTAGPHQTSAARRWSGSSYGLRATDPAWVHVRLQHDLARATKLELLGHSDEALRLYEGVAHDYPPSPETSRAAERAGVLRSTPAVERYRKEAGKLAEKDREQAGELQKTFRWARSLPDPPTPETLVEKLRIAKLKKTAEHGDSLQAASGERLLARIFAELAFYEPRTYIAQHSPNRALAMLEAATRIGPLEGASCALLRAALRAAPQEQQPGLKGQCAPAQGETES
jgi:hypothetical protein